MEPLGPSDCPFCCLAAGRVWREDESTVAFKDGYPVTEGHTLVIPRRHVVSIFDCSPEEQAALWKMVKAVQRTLIEEFQPDGFNIGVNDGEAAGQTVLHAHVHVIPRRNGDVSEPRGGIRWVIADKAAYWVG
jgi:diadenosine tetraphosphate (Ap4A) HIT family hydrolase